LFDKEDIFDILFCVLYLFSCMLSFQKIVSLWIISSILLFSTFYNLSANFFWPYERIYDTGSMFGSTYIFFGVNQGIWYDEESGHSYIKLANPTQVWFGNEEIAWLEYPLGIQYEIPYTFASKKRDFWGRMLFLEYSCDKNEYHQWECETEKWKQAIEKTQWKNIAIWVSSFSTQIVDHTVPMQGFPFVRSVELKDFFFSKNNLPGEYMSNFDFTLIPERELYQKENTLTLYIPEQIAVIEEYSCQKQPEFSPWWWGYKYHSNPVYVLSKEYFPIYPFYGMTKWSYHPFIKNYVAVGNDFQKWEFDAELFQFFISSVLQDVNFCESEQKSTVKRSVFPFLFPNLQNLLRQ